MAKIRDRSGFTLIELMVVIMIVGVLVAVVIPILRDKNEAAKWSEAAATAGTIRSVVRTEFAEDPIKVAAWSGQAVTGVMSDLGFTAGDLTGRYFDDSHFTIASVDAANGNATITVTAPAGLTGSAQLDSANGWVVTP